MDNAVIEKYTYYASCTIRLEYLFMLQDNCFLREVKVLCLGARSPGFDSRSTNCVRALKKTKPYIVGYKLTTRVPHLQNFLSGA